MQDSDYNEYQLRLRQAKKTRKVGHFEEALFRYRQALAIQEGDMNAMQAVAEIQLKLGCLIEATETYLTMARYYAKRGFGLKAIAMYKKYFKTPINLADTPLLCAKLELAKVYGEQSMQVKQAQTLLEVVDFHASQVARYSAEALEVVRTITDPAEMKLMVRILRDLPPDPPENSIQM